MMFSGREGSKIRFLIMPVYETAEIVRWWRELTMKC